MEAAIAKILVKKGIENAVSEAKKYIYEQGSISLSLQTRQILGISDFLLLKKIKTFMTGSFHNYSEDKIIFSSKLNNLKFEKIFIYLDGIDDLKKIKLAGLFFRQYLLGQIDEKTLFEIFYVIKNSFLDDLKHIQNFYNGHKLITLKEQENRWEKNQEIDIKRRNKEISKEEEVIIEQRKKEAEEQMVENARDIAILRGNSTGITIGLNVFGGTLHVMTPLGETLFKNNFITGDIFDGFEF